MGEFALLEVGTVVASRYRVQAVLGRGGMGAVYRAHDPSTGRRVALKVLRADLYEREDLVRRFEREARAAARIGHESIVGVQAVGHDDRLRAHYIVQECLHGVDVAACLNELGSLSPESAIAVALPVMDALIAAHAVGIVHRDIKPENVFLHERDDGVIVPKVIDFGIAKVADALDRIQRTATGMVFGTPWYMSPEQAEGSSGVDARTDVWSVGAMLYEMVCGTLPFGASNPNAVMAQIIFGQPTPVEHHWPAAPADLKAVIHRALERDLDKRYASMREFRDDLAACALWRGVSPAIAQVFLPRPSALDGVEYVLPAEFLDAPAEHPSAETPVCRRPIASEPAAAQVAAAPTPKPPADPARRAPWIVAGVGVALSMLCTAVFALGAAQHARRPSVDHAAYLSVAEQPRR
jgi:eukaryotic-like serine/threonine-protein kinase